MASQRLHEARDIAAQSGGWVEVKRGSLIRIIDVEGAQVADMFAVSTADKREWLSAAHTRAATSRLFPKAGQSFFTNRYRPILTFVADRSPGVHDMLYRSCDPLMYEQLGVIGHHPNCHENFQRAAAEAGWMPPDVPDPVNFFQNTPLNAEGDLDVQTALSKAGDSVTLRVEMDLVLVVTACSMDNPPINGAHCSGIRIEVRSDIES